MLCKWFYKVAIFAVGILWRFWFSLKIYGAENEPKGKGGYILASNHCSSIDPMVVVQGIHHNYVHFMSKAELFDIKVLSPVIRALGAFPVSRGTGDTTAIDTAIQTIQNNEVLGLFPEGTRSKDGNLQRFKSGLALIAQKTGAPVLPVTITYTNGKKFRSKVVVTYGKLISHEELGLVSGEARELKEATRKLHAIMEDLKSQNLEDTPSHSITPKAQL